MSRTHIAVIDIGKTNAKVALVDPNTMTEVAVTTRPNDVIDGPPWPRYDVAGLWTFFIRSLAEFQASHGIEAISITTHGAAIVLLDQNGRLVAPVLDYEHDGPNDTREEYNKIRPPFSETGSPTLDGGLNVGAQLFWQFQSDPTLQDRTAHILSYPQFWAYGLTGHMANEVTSLGCHTDLWNPQTGSFSTLVDRLGIREKLAPLTKADDCYGTLRSDIAKQTGLPPSVKVASGIHDSNASILPYLHTQKDPFCVVSTGTWVVSMAVGGQNIELSEENDTLYNVNAFGQPMPSARFMGGREFEILGGSDCPTPNDDNIQSVLEHGTMLLPAVVPETGPFQNQNMKWIGQEPAATTGERAACISLYLALVTCKCLKLIGARGPIFIEGSFATNALFLEMLEVATGQTVIPNAGGTGTSIGASYLVGGRSKSEQAQGTTSPHQHSKRADALRQYAAAWTAAIS